MALKASVQWCIFVAASVVLSGCLWNQKPETGAMKLGELLPLQVSSNKAFIRVSTDEQIQRYQSLLSYVQTAKLRAQILSRIANLEMTYQEQLSEQSLEEEDDSVYLADYQKTILQYQDLLDAFPFNKGNDAIYYQMAKAYDLAGDTQGALVTLTTLVNKYPASKYVTESHFRRGDYFFTLRKYRNAGAAYKAVITAGTKTSYYENAIYMQAWSLFKQGNYESALTVFTEILDRHLGGEVSLTKVENAKLLLVQDSIRITAIIFSYLDGVSSLTEYYAQQGVKTYTPLIYKSLAALYADKERYHDAILTYRAFIRAYPISNDAPVFANKIMETMRAARFLQKIPVEKENFIKTYGIKSPFYEFASLESQLYMRDYLHLYIDEVGRNYHAKAARQLKSLRRYKAAPPKKTKIMRQLFAQAINYHQLYISTFPDDFHTSEKAFLIAEAYAQMKQWPQAILAYESAAYDYTIHDRSEKAAYAAILVQNQLLRKAKREHKARRQKQKLAAELAFVDHFATSQYVRPILLTTTDTFYRQKKYQQAFEQAEAFLVKYPDTNKDELLMLNLVAGHSSFELQQYKTAETYYHKAMLTLNKQDKRYKDVFKRTAASIYKQGELLAKSGKKLEAVEEFLRVGQFSPHSSYRKTAEYDAVTYLIQEKQFERAISLLAEYRKRYDPRKTDLDITGKLIACYEGLSQFELAASELKRVFRDEKDPEKRRQALFLSAEYYEKSNQLDKALDTYKAYSHQYSEPFDLAMETRFKLSEMYRKKNDKNRRNYWLDKVIVADKKAGSKRTARSKYLAAYSRNVFAEVYLSAFKKIKLSQPLSRSMPKKKSALEAALKRYQWILSYEIQEFSTLANYNVAEIYATLSRDMMNSERPKGLNELELEEYDLLLEEQAYPFEEKATEIHEANLENSWHGNYDKWVGESVLALATLYPAKYKKEEEQGGISESIY